MHGEGSAFRDCIGVRRAAPEGKQKMITCFLVLETFQKQWIFLLSGATFSLDLCQTRSPRNHLNGLLFLGFQFFK